MKKSKATIILVSILVLAMTFGATFGANAAGIVSVNVEGTYCQTEARSMLTDINNFRSSSDAWYWNKDDSTKTVCSNLKPLVYDYTLEKIAMQRAAEIAVYNSHNRPDGSSWTTAFDNEKLYGTIKGENLLCGTGTINASTAYSFWREDNNKYSGQGHRRNMLGEKDYVAVGIAKFVYQGKTLWVQEFYGESVNATETAANDSVASVPMNVDSAKLKEYGLDALTTGPAIAYSTTAPAPSTPAAKPSAKPTTKAPAVKKPSPTKITGAKAGKKQFKVNWKKINGVQGYQIQYSTSAKFKGKTTKTLTVSNANVTALTVKKLKSKKKYYIRVRTFNTSNGKPLYSKWSAKKAVKVK